MHCDCQLAPAGPVAEDPELEGVDAGEAGPPRANTSGNDWWKSTFLVNVPVCA